MLNQFFYFIKFLRNNCNLILPLNNYIYLEDYKYVFSLIKKNNFYFFLGLFFLTPIISFFFSIYCIIVLIYLSIYIFILFFYCFESYLYINEFYSKHIFYKFPVSDENSEVIEIIKIFIDMAKKQAFIFLYIFIKNIKKKKNISLKNLIVILINFILRLFFMLIFNYSIKIIKISSIFFDIFFKNLKRNNKFPSKSFFEGLFIDFIMVYNDYFNKFVKISKIIITSDGIFLNPKNYVDLMLDLLNSKFKLSKQDLLKMAECLQVIKDNSFVRYTTLREEVDKKYPGVFKIDKNGKFYIGEEIPHTSLIIGYKENNSILYRETKQLSIPVKKIVFEDGVEKEIDYRINTGFKNYGSINKNLTTYKTPTIESENKNIHELNNIKLLNNIRNGLVNKDDFLNQFIGSIFKPVYIFEKGNLYKDQKYLNFYEKITTEFSELNNRSELMNALNDIVQI